MSSSKDIEIRDGETRDREMQGRDAQRGVSAGDASADASVDDGARDLLLGLLYGELDDDDAARAERRVCDDSELAHELEGWEQIRSLMRELPQEEPPDAISVKLMHAAAEASKGRGADREAHGGVWGWFKNLFAPVMMYPGLAAATSLVLVAGITGAVYLSGQSVKSMMSEPRVAAPAAAPVEVTLERAKQEALPGSATLAGDEGAAGKIARDEGDLVARDQVAAAADDRAWGAEEQAALPDTPAAEVPAEPATGNAQGGFLGDLAADKAEAAGPGGGDGEDMATGRGGAGSGAYGEAELSQRRARKSDSRSAAVERKEAIGKGRAAPAGASVGSALDGLSGALNDADRRTAPTADLYEGGELDDVRQNRARSATTRDSSNAGASPYAQPPPPPASSSSPSSAGAAVGGGGGAALPAQKKLAKNKDAPDPAKPAPARQQEPTSAPAADEDAPAAEAEAAEAPQDSAPAPGAPAPSAPAPSAPAPRKKKVSKTASKSTSSSERSRADDSEDQGTQARVRELHRRALAAAKKNDCDVVSNLARQVRELDAQFYRSAFLGNKSLQACLGDSKKAIKK